MEFLNGPADRLTDGLPYVNGLGGVSCVIFSSTTGDLSCNLSSTNPVRVFNVDASQRISGTGPTYSFSSNGGVTIGALAQMRVGDTKLTYAQFGTPEGSIQFVGTLTQLTPGTSAVIAERYSDYWRVVTGDQAPPAAGDIAYLIQFGNGNRAVNRGFYHLPFEIRVTCPTCVAPQ